MLLNRIQHPWAAKLHTTKPLNTEIDHPWNEDLLWRQDFICWVFDFTETRFRNCSWNDNATSTITVNSNQIFVKFRTNKISIQNIKSHKAKYKIFTIWLIFFINFIVIVLISCLLCIFLFSQRTDSLVERVECIWNDDCDKRALKLMNKLPCDKILCFYSTNKKFINFHNKWYRVKDINQSNKHE